VYAIFDKIGVVVRYNPCSKYARGGIPCPYFKNGQKRCSKPLQLCEMPEYDQWYRKILAGKLFYFHLPKRLYLLEISGVPLFVYHSHIKKIVGEASITRVTKKNEIFYYWFDKFLSYPNFVDLSQIKTDKSLHKMAGKGRLRFKYLDKATIREIRDLSQLPVEIKEELSNRLEYVHRKVGTEITKLRCATYSADKLTFAQNKLKEIKLEHNVDDEVLNKTYEILTHAIKKRILRGRRTLDFIYASLYIAYRLMKVPLTSREFSHIYNLKERKLLSYYHFLLKHLNLTVPRQNAKEIATYYLNRLPVSKETQRLTISTIEKVQKTLKIKKSPRVVAATITFAVCKKNNEAITQEQIATSFGISTLSIRNTLKLFSETGICKA